MKSDNQIYDVNSQSKSKSQWLLLFSYSISERNILQTVLLPFFFFSVFVFSVPSKVMIIGKQFMFMGINIFWALLRAHFNPRLTAAVKMSLSQAENVFIETLLLYFDVI